MGNFSKAILIASVAFCLHISASSQGISLKNREITVKEAMELLKEKIWLLVCVFICGCKYE